MTWSSALAMVNDVNKAELEFRETHEKRKTKIMQSSKHNDARTPTTSRLAMTHTMKK
jgi:hypothetical protein